MIHFCGQLLLFLTHAHYINKNNFCFIHTYLVDFCSYMTHLKSAHFWLIFNLEFCVELISDATFSTGWVEDPCELRAKLKRWQIVADYRLVREAHHHWIVPVCGSPGLQKQTAGDEWSRWRAVGVCVLYIWHTILFDTSQKPETSIPLFSATTKSHSSSKEKCYHSVGAISEHRRASDTRASADVTSSCLVTLFFIIMQNLYDTRTQNWPLDKYRTEFSFRAVFRMPHISSPVFPRVSLYRQTVCINGLQMQMVCTWTQCTPPY